MASISLRSIPGRKAIFALLIIEELNLSEVSAPSLLSVRLKDPKSPNLTILPSERCLESAFVKSFNTAKTSVSLTVVEPPAISLL